MKLEPADLSKLRFSLIATLMMLAVGATSLHFVVDANRAAQQARDAAQAEWNEFNSKLKRIHLEEQEIRDKSAIFNLLQARGVIGNEQRLEWVELLKDIRDKRQLLEMQYEFSPQRRLDPNPIGEFSFYASAMKLQLKLLHEEDLTRLLDDLRQQAKALIQVKQCSISRQPRETSERGPAALLQAECQIDWITLREGSGQ